jgi:peptide/nickel transport system permease protein
MTAAPPTIAMQTMQRARRARRAVTARIVVPLIVIALFIVGAVIVPILYGYDPLRTDVILRLKPPGTTLPDG